MKLSTLKVKLAEAETLNFRLENGTFVPKHFHITEIGFQTKHFIDCGGTVREEQKVTFQLWYSTDYEHRLKPQKLLNIIRLAERKVEIADVEIEVEYQTESIGKFGLDFDGENFVLTTTQTACLAEDQCGITLQVTNVVEEKQGCCTPGGGCC